MTFSRRNNKRNNFENFNLDKRMDQFIEVGRQFVDGVSGTRPGKRKNSNLQQFSKRNAKNVSQWVSKKMDSIFEDESQEDWDTNNDLEDETEYRSYRRSERYEQDMEKNFKRKIWYVDCFIVRTNVHSACFINSCVTDLVDTGDS